MLLESEYAYIPEILKYKYFIQIKEFCAFSEKKAFIVESLGYE
jgi:hypothetical protein